MNKRAQFYIIGIVFIAFAFLLLFTYLNTVEQASVSMFEDDSKFIVFNAINAAQEKNDWLKLKDTAGAGEGWWNLSWDYRKKFTISALANKGNWTMEVDLKIPIKHVANCQDEIRLVNATPSIHPSDTNSSTPPCSIVFSQQLVSGETYTFWAYYNNSGAIAPDYRDIAAGNAPDAVFSSNVNFIEEQAGICRHLNVLPYGANRFNCSIANFINTDGDVDNETTNYSLIFDSPNFKYNGWAS